MILQYLESDRFTDTAGQTPGAGPADARTRDNVITVIIPAGTTFFAVEPVKAHERRHLHSTLPWRLEELLLDPVEQYHFAHGEINESGTELLAVERRWLEDFLQQCEQAGYRPDKVVCRYSLVPWRPGQISLWQDTTNDTVLVRDQAGQGISITTSRLAGLLELLVHSRDLPDAVVLYGEAAWARTLATMCPEVLAERIQIRAQPSLPEALLQADGRACNLLQGAYSAALPWAAWWRLWRWAALVLAAILITDLVATAASIWQFQGSISRADSEIQAGFERAMPGAVLVDARLQLERAVAGLGGGAADGLVVLLTRMAPALDQLPEAEILSMNYDQGSGSLQLLVRSADINVVQALRTSLQNLGLRAELQGSNSNSEGTQSRLRVGV